MKRMFMLLLPALLSTLLLLPAANAAERAGVTLPDSVETGGGQLALNGLALRSVFVFDVYVAGLYLPERSSDAEAILQADAPRRMVMHFVRDVGKDDLCKGWEKGLAKNTPDAGEALKADFAKLCEMMRDIQDGQEMIFTYLPGQGTEVQFAGENAGLLPGKEFADALWNCWIGPNPDPGKGFKKDLLGLD